MARSHGLTSLLGAALLALPLLSISARHKDYPSYVTSKTLYATIPELGEWQKKFKDDLVVIGISAEDAQTVKDFMAKTSMPYNVGVDPQKTTESVLGVQGIPHVIVMSAIGASKADAK